MERFRKKWARIKLEWTWAINRIVIAMRFLEASRNGRTLELKWQQIQQYAHDLAHKGNTEAAIEAKGFVAGIKYCINREWKNED